MTLNTEADSVFYRIYLRDALMNIYPVGGDQECAITQSVHCVHTVHVSAFISLQGCRGETLQCSAFPIPPAMNFHHCDCMCVVLWGPAVAGCSDVTSHIQYYNASGPIQWSPGDRGIVDSRNRWIESFKSFLTCCLKLSVSS